MTSHRIALLVVVALSVSALTSAATKTPADVRVLSFIPSSTEASPTDLSHGIQITFDQDVVPYAEVGQVVTDALVIKPAAAGEARWADRRTLAFSPKTSLEPSTTYEVRLAPALAAKIGGQVPSWSGLHFVFDRIRIVGADVEGDVRYQPLRPGVQVSLSHATSPRALAAACSFCPLATSTSTPCIAAALAREDLVQPSSTVPVTPQTDLNTQTGYSLRCTAPTHRAHVALVDRLPAGFEPVLERFANAEEWRQGRAQTDDPAHWSTLWQNQELRDDRMLIFADTLGEGLSEHEYLVRAASTGTFVAPPATIEAMYEPSVQGRSAAGTVEIEK